jgi:hypothetical protein
MTEFCDACHGDTAPGASTNVASGVFDSGPSASSTGTVGAVGATTGSDGGAVRSMYKTDSVFNAPLNGGGFTRMPDPYAWQTSTSISYLAATSAHKMDVSGPLWGAGSSPQLYGGTVGLTCTDCHDPHGTSNYRLLKAQVNGQTVGGYDSNDVPTAFVFSNERGYPVPTYVANPGGGVQVGSLPNGGWLKHEDGAAQMALYRPNYTDTTGTPILHTETLPQTKSMSVWCSACHTNYNQANAAAATTYDYTPYLPAYGSPATPAQIGSKAYHRHAVDQNMAAGIGVGRALAEQVVSDPAWVPLENPGSGGGSWSDGYIGCLTCHRAHGSSVEMTGWAAAHLSTNTAGVYVPVIDNVPGVDPSKTTTQGTSSLLRANNRGVCERCHNK